MSVLCHVVRIAWPAALAGQGVGSDVPLAALAESLCHQQIKVSLFIITHF